MQEKIKDDTISRQAAIEYCYALINAENPSDEWNYSQERINQTEVILHHLEFMPSAQPEQRWIPCSEKPPKEGIYYLVWMPFAPPENRITVARRCDGYWDIKTPISAWMPLPEPYREESEG